MFSSSKKVLSPQTKLSLFLACTAINDISPINLSVCAASVTNDPSHVNPGSVAGLSPSSVVTAFCVRVPKQNALPICTVCSPGNGLGVTPNRLFRLSTIGNVCPTLLAPLGKSAGVPDITTRSLFSSTLFPLSAQKMKLNSFLRSPSHKSLSASLHVPSSSSSGSVQSTSSSCVTFKFAQTHDGLSFTLRLIVSSSQSPGFKSE